MPVNGIDHVNIRTTDLDASAAFYAELLGLGIDRPPPPFHDYPARWLRDAGGRPIIHLRHADGDEGQTGAVDHVALACTGRAAVVATLERLGRSYTLGGTPGGGAIVLTRDPHGLMLELNFAD